MLVYHFNSGDTVEIDTHSRYSYNTSWLDVVGKASFEFQIQACSDVHLALARIPGEAAVQSYEVVIGGWQNSKSAIRKFPLESPPSFQMDTPDILDCGEFRQFWVSWLDGDVRVGRGAVVGEDELMAWKDTSQPHSVNSVGLSTATGSAGTYKIQYFEGVYRNLVLHTYLIVKVGIVISKNV